LCQIAASAALATLQESALRLEPSLLRVLERALPANLAWRAEQGRRTPSH
jgi:hypothetical protein